MKRSLRAVFYMFVLISTLVLSSAAQEETDADNSHVTVGDGPVWVVPVEGTIDLGLASFISREVAEAEQAHASVILFEINTFGGRVDAAAEIVDAITRTSIPTATWVTDRAWSAGALIALATDLIWMAPGSSIGAAEPRPADEKTISALRAEFESLAERTGRDPLIAAAMVDARVEVDGLSPSGDILTLTARAAVSVGYAEGIANNRQAIKDALGAPSHPETVAALNWAEQVARFLTAPVISEILLTLAFLGLIAEVTTPGFGVPGAVGLTSLLLFFGGRFVIGMVGWEVLLLFTLGVFLLVIELVVIPGFGVIGLLGIASIIGSLIMSYGALELALRSLGIVLLITVIGTAVLWRYGRRRALWGRFILSETSPLAGPEEDHHVSHLQSIVQKEGRSLTVLRPAGVVMIDGERYDAVSSGGYIPADKRIVVIRVDGSRVVVNELPDGDK